MDWSNDLYSEYTDLGSYKNELSLIAPDIPALCQWIQSHLIHAYWLESYHCYTSLATAHREMQLRSALDILSVLSQRQSADLVNNLTPDKRVIVVGRHFALMLCALIRMHDTPARVRCGYADYLVPDVYEDHWICEYWHEQQQRWVGVDAMLDERQMHRLAITFNPYDLPSDSFIPAGRAWKHCIDGLVRPDHFGSLHFHGLVYIRGNIIRDLFALSSVELLPWDGGWGMMEQFQNPLKDDREIQLITQLATYSESGDEANARVVTQHNPDVALPQDWTWLQAPTISQLFEKTSVL